MFSPSQNLILSQFSQRTNNASNKWVSWLTLRTIIIIVIIGIRRNINNACCDRRAWPTREFANMFQWNIFDVMIIMTMSLIFVCQFLFLSDVAASAALKKCTHVHCIRMWTLTRKRVPKCDFSQILSFLLRSRVWRCVRSWVPAVHQCFCHRQGPYRRSSFDERCAAAKTLEQWTLLWSIVESFSVKLLFPMGLAVCVCLRFTDANPKRFLSNGIYAAMAAQKSLFSADVIRKTN